MSTRTDWRLRARMQTLGQTLFYDTESADYSNPEHVEEIAREAAELLAVAKSWLVLVHDYKQVPYDPANLLLDKMRDNMNVTTQLKELDKMVVTASMRRNRN